jgi:hypothetical protein
MKGNPYISLSGCITAIIFIVAMVGVTLAVGGVLFSPGLLSAQGNDRPPLKEFASHVDFEGRCEYCHEPWKGVTAARCEECHAHVAEERQTATGVHGVLKDTANCSLCHIEHKGRTADQTALAMISFPHEQTGYSLVKHQTRTAGQPFRCRDCHDPLQVNYTFEPARCEACHREVDAAFVNRHVAQYSADCLACHHQLNPFDHGAFPLHGGHAKLQCDQCHKSADFSKVSAECSTCHADPPIHAGMFGTDCAVCHTIEGWLPAKLSKHDFPIDHGGEGDIKCATCHVKSYREYTCYNCHEHSDEAEIRAKHIEKGMPEFSDCMKCHADGKTHKQ